MGLPNRSILGQVGFKNARTFFLSKLIPQTVIASGIAHKTGVEILWRQLSAAAGFSLNDPSCPGEAILQR